MLKPSLQLRLGQRQAMTPQLQQAIRLLQLSSYELQQAIQESLEQNVMLELEDESEFGAWDEAHVDAPFESSDSEAPEVAADDALPEGSENPWADALPAGSSDRSRDDDAETELSDPSGETLQEHLLWQLELSKLTRRELEIGRAIVDAINDDGYLTDPFDAIAAVLEPEFEVSSDEIDNMLHIVQTFDPPGVGARSVAECLELQLCQMPRSTPGRRTALALVRDHLERVGENDRRGLCRALGVDVEEIDRAIALVRTCTPRPGARIQPDTTDFVVPDVLVRRSAGRWQVDLNPAAVPRIRVNPAYSGLVGREHTALRAQLQDARWLVKSIEMRNETLLKVARCIVSRQQAFLDQGDEAMQPMVLREVAAAVEMHESSISRVTSGKYMHTPRGTYELRFFFSSHVAAADGTEVSSTAIRAKIRKLIAGESADDPLSDSRIAELLATDGAKVARRTVAKYREAMKIAPSSERRKPAQ